MKTIHPSTTLSPAQQKAYDQLLSFLPKSRVLGLVSGNGFGRTTVLENLAEATGGKLLRLSDVFENLRRHHPLALEEGIVETLLQAFDEHERVLIDDLHVLDRTLTGCYTSARPNVLGVAFDAVARQLEGSDKQLIAGTNGRYLPGALSHRALFAGIPPFSPEDFAFLFGKLSEGKLKEIAYERIHHFAPRLTAHQMRTACIHLEPVKEIDTETFLRFLESHALVSNVNRQEVEEVDLDQLFGIEEVIRQLEINIIVPLERDELAKKYGLQPKRGVLLYGPPGTGKTTIGRALAHRLRSKFFLIDGTVISGTNQFYGKIQQIFEEARKNAPCVLFIDDCDLLFEKEEETGLYRYLLTVLDGLESKENALITVMLTAMNIASLPPALIRSGRVELWLEMKLPDASARASILKSFLQGSPVDIEAAGMESITAQTEGLTGADLRRVAADAKNLYGYDVAKDQPPQPPSHYLEQAIEQLRVHKEQLEKAPAYTAAHHPSLKMKEFLQRQLLNLDETNLD